MSDTQETKIEPITASADGKRNAYSRRCEAIGQTMNYAACLWRQSVLAKPDIKTPADWSPCAEAAKCGNCNALKMREEEVLKGHAIYFKDRNVFAKVGHAAREWIMPTYGVKTLPERSAPKVESKPAPKKASSMLDVMGEGSGYADAINSISMTEKTSTPASRVIPVAMPGESPLAMARRLAAERAAKGA